MLILFCQGIISFGTSTLFSFRFLAGSVQLEWLSLQDAIARADPSTSAAASAAASAGTFVCGVVDDDFLLWHRMFILDVVALLSLLHVTCRCSSLPQAAPA
jgi:hypothetical protein